jgi:hypothetical protein
MFMDRKSVFPNWVFYIQCNPNKNHKLFDNINKMILNKRNIQLNIEEKQSQKIALTNFKSYSEAMLVKSMVLTKDYISSSMEQNK